MIWILLWYINFFSWKCRGDIIWGGFGEQEGCSDWRHYTIWGAWEHFQGQTCWVVGPTCIIHMKRHASIMIFWPYINYWEPWQHLTELWHCFHIFFFSGKSLYEMTSCQIHAFVSLTCCAWFYIIEVASALLIFEIYIYNISCCIINS